MWKFLIYCFIFILLYGLVVKSLSALAKYTDKSAPVIYKILILNSSQDEKMANEMRNAINAVLLSQNYKRDRFRHYNAYLSKEVSNKEIGLFSGTYRVETCTPDEYEEDEENYDKGPISTYCSIGVRGGDLFDEPYIQSVISRNGSFAEYKKKYLNEEYSELMDLSSGQGVIKERDKLYSQIKKMLKEKFGASHFKFEYETINERELFFCSEYMAFASACVISKSVRQIDWNLSN